jgi:hypothetical protein
VASRCLANRQRLRCSPGQVLRNSVADRHKDVVHRVRLVRLVPVEPKVRNPSKPRPSLSFPRFRAANQEQVRRIKIQVSKVFVLKCPAVRKDVPVLCTSFCLTLRKDEPRLREATRQNDSGKKKDLKERTNDKKKESSGGTFSSPLSRRRRDASVDEGRFR